MKNPDTYGIRIEDLETIEEEHETTEEEMKDRERDSKWENTLIENESDEDEEGEKEWEEEDNIEGDSDQDNNDEENTKESPEEAYKRQKRWVDEWERKAAIHNNAKGIPIQKDQEWSFEHELSDYPRINEESPYDRHYKRIGARHFFKANVLGEGASQGEYTLTGLWEKAKTREIIAVFGLLRKNITKKEAKEDPLFEWDKERWPNNYEEYYERKWREVRRNKSRTIPEWIDADADLNPDIIRLVRLRVGL